MPSRANPIDLFGKENNPNRANDTYQGDIKFMPGDQRFEKGPKGRGLMRTSSTYLWPNGVVAYNIDPNANYSATKIQLILDSMAILKQASFTDRLAESEERSSLPCKTTVLAHACIRGL